jgi:hypothetical protein
MSRELGGVADLGPQAGSQAILDMDLEFEQAVEAVK